MKPLLRLLLTLIIFLLPLQTAYIIIERFLGGMKWQYGSEVLYVTQLLIGVALIVQLIIWWKEHQAFLLSSRHFLRVSDVPPLLLVCFCVWLPLSLIWSSNAGLSWYYAVQILLAIACGVMIRFNQISARSIAQVFAAAGFVQALLVFRQWQSQQIWGNVWLGISEKLAQDAGVAVVLADGERWLRAYSTFTHPNVAGGFLAIVIVAVVWLIMHTTSRARMAYMASLPVLLFALGFTFSRSALLAMIAGVCVILAYAFFEKISLHKIMAIIAIIGASSGLFIWIHYDLVASRIIPTTMLEQRSLDERVVSVSETVDRITISPLFGTGLGTYTFVSSQQFPDQSAWAYQPAHIMWLLMLSEIGVVGWLLFMTITICLVWRARKNSLMIGMCMVLCIISLFDHYLWTSWSGILLWWIVVLGVKE